MHGIQTAVFFFFLTFFPRKLTKRHHFFLRDKSSVTPFSVQWEPKNNVWPNVQFSNDWMGTLFCFLKPKVTLWKKSALGRPLVHTEKCFPFFSSLLFLEYFLFQSSEGLSGGKNCAGNTIQQQRKCVAHKAHIMMYCMAATNMCLARVARLHASIDFKDHAW